MNDKELKETLDNILFQLHVITSQNFTAFSQTQGDDPISENTREYGLNGVLSEQRWMQKFMERKQKEKCASGTGS